MLLSQEFKLRKFDDSIKSIVLKNYFNFQGRSPRVDIIWWFVFTTIINFSVNQIDPKYGIFLSIIFLLPGLGLSIRRLHDINKSAWNFLWLITIIGIIPFYYWLIFKPGDNCNNKYGDNMFKDENLQKVITTRF